MLFVLMNGRVNGGSHTARACCRGRPRGGGSGGRVPAAPYTPSERSDACNDRWVPKDGQRGGRDRGPRRRSLCLHAGARRTGARQRRISSSRKAMFSSCSSTASSMRSSKLPDRICLPRRRSEAAARARSRQASHPVASSRDPQERFSEGGLHLWSLPRRLRWPEKRGNHTASLR